MRQGLAVLVAAAVLLTLYKLAAYPPQTAPPQRQEAQSQATSRWQGGGDRAAAAEEAAVVKQVQEIQKQLQEVEESVLIEQQLARERRAQARQRPKAPPMKPPVVVREPPMVVARSAPPPAQRPSALRPAGPTSSHAYDEANSMLLHTGEGKPYPPKVRGKPKGNATPDLLFDLNDACDSRRDYTPPARLCLGAGPNRQARGSCSGNEVERGTFDTPPRTGGPTGCHQAWMTVQGDDSFLAATLVLIHTIRKYSRYDRDIVVIASTAVTTPILRQLLDECVRVIQVDPFDGNDLAKQLVSKSERYRSGYWLLKMYVWRAMEYSKVVFLDGDIYFRHTPDALFCAPTPPKKAPIAVTPRSSQSPSAGFNAGMFVFNPSRVTFQGILKKFLGLTEQQMLATSEQDFLNEFFAGRYNLVPIDFVCKHRRIVNEGTKKWDMQRVVGYHMNGNPKPWNPTWRTGCAYPEGHAAKLDKYVEFFKEWWHYYYDMIGRPVPYDTAQYALLPKHDLYKVRWSNWNPMTYRCPTAPKAGNLK